LHEEGRSLLIVSPLLFFVALSHGDYTAADFFTDAPPEYITGIEPISAEEKADIIESGFAPAEGTAGPFSVRSCEPDRLRLRDIDIHVYQIDEGGYLVLVTSILGNHGQNQHTSFFAVDHSGEIKGELDPIELGIREVLSNEFLSPEEHFPDEENYPVPLYVREDGSFQAEPWMWMNDDWLNRNILREIFFIWNGREFKEESRACIE